MHTDDRWGVRVSDPSYTTERETSESARPPTTKMVACMTDVAPIRHLNDTITAILPESIPNNLNC